MARVINVQDLIMRIGARQLVAGATFRVDKGMRIGLVGRNGAGKTTMTKLLAAASVEQGTGHAVADADDRHGLEAVEHEGTISCNGSVGYLPQDTRVGDLTEAARDRILSARGIDTLLVRIREAEERIATTEGDAMAKALDRYTRVDHEFTMAGGYAAASEAARIAAALGLPDRVLDQEIGTLSGGQRRRVELARVLFQRPDTLLLDEPTNHLDHDSVLWLRDHLRAYSGGFIVISHDVELLRNTVNQIMHLDADRGVLDVYHLGWDAYLKQRADDEHRRRRERANAEKKAAALRAQGEKMRAKATKAVAAQQMLKRADRLMEGLEDERIAERVARLRFPDPAPCGKTPLRASGLSKAYGSLEVFAGVDLAIDRGSRVVVLGLNGAGKTTLLRLLGGVEEPDSGEVIVGHGLKIGYTPRSTRRSTPPGPSWRICAAPPRAWTRRRCAACSAPSCSPAPTPTSPPESCPAARKPAWRWPCWSSPAPTSCCWTNPPTTSTRPVARRFSGRWGPSPAPSCSSPTTRGRSRPWVPTGCSSCPTATRICGARTISSWWRWPDRVRERSVSRSQ